MERSEARQKVAKRLGDILAERHPWESKVPGPFQLLARYSPEFRETFNRIGDFLTVASEFSDPTDVRDVLQGSQGLVRGLKAGNYTEAAGEGARMLGGAVGVAAGPFASGLGDVAKYMTIGAITAFHGTPHRFDKFDVGKIGTGEGAQAFGHGLYFASKEEVANYYKHWLGRLPRINGSPVNESSGAAEAYVFRAKGDAKAAIKAAESDVAMLRQSNKKIDKFRADAAQEVLDELRKWDAEGAIQPPGGHLYKVDLAPTEDELLDWDKPLSQQSEKVQSALRDLGIGGSEMKQARVNDIVSEMQSMARDGPLDNQRWANLAKERDRLIDELKAGESGADVYESLGALVQPYAGGDSKKLNRLISQELRDAGIRGIKYLEGGSRAAGEGGHNYVIFDDADIKILERR